MTQGPADWEELTPVIGKVGGASPWAGEGASPHIVRKVVRFEPDRVLSFQSSSSSLQRVLAIAVRVAAAIGFCLVTIVGFLHLRQPGPIPESLFSIVIDAGSTGSRVHVFRFEGRSGRLLDIGGQAEVFRSTKPGLSACAGNLSRVSQLLQPLVDAAVAAVPAEQHQSTPISVRATAGLRLLPGNEADLILEETRRFLGSYKFVDAGVEVMSGDDEGTFQWVAVNSLLGTLLPGGTPAVVLDLGGGSVQVAYGLPLGGAGAVPAGRREEYIRELDLPDGAPADAIYQHSYLGFGLMAARAKMLAEAEALGNSDVNPCVPSGAQVTYTYTNRTYIAGGVGQAGACANLITAMLHREAACGEGQQAYECCSFDGVWAGPGWGMAGADPPPIAACSYFFDGLEDAGAIPDGIGEVPITPATYLKLAEEACSATPEAAVARYSRVSAKRAAWMCFDLTYLGVLLTSGFGFSPDQPVRAVKDIVHEGLSYGATWALGVAMHGLSATPPRTAWPNFAADWAQPPEPTSPS